MKNRLVVLLSVLLLVGSLPLSGTVAASTKKFTDVPSSKHFTEAVYDLAERNIIGGYPDGTFKPGNTISRGQAAAIIAKMIKLDMSAVKNPGFKDVTTANGYYKAIAALAEKGIISGYGDGRYGPNDPIKRGQMASILVKAFDLPRYNDTNNSINNPFKDVEVYSYPPSHGVNILILYKLGIVSGTSPDKFSPNAFITRGQAAKMLKVTEEMKPPMITLKASDIGLDNIGYIKTDQKDTRVFDGILVKGKELPKGDGEGSIQFVPLKEGIGTLVVTGSKSDSMVFKKYYVHIQKENGELKLTLEETDDHLPTTVSLLLLLGKGELPSDAVQNISLSTMDGVQLSDNIEFEYCMYNDSVCFDIDQPGQYIATVLFSDGEEVRYGIEVKAHDSDFYYGIRTVRENISDVYDMGADYNIGKHIIQTKDAEQIATITRDPGTNLFRAHATGQKEGEVFIGFEHKVTEKYCDETWCYLNDWIGIHVIVERIGSISSVRIYRTPPY
ncbi:S-layer homology domain-containing protein [Solibacillus silvestris]